MLQNSQRRKAKPHNISRTEPSSRAGAVKQEFRRVLGPSISSFRLKSKAVGITQYCTRYSLSPETERQHRWERAGASSGVQNPAGVLLGRKGCHPISPSPSSPTGYYPGSYPAAVCPGGLPTLDTSQVSDSCQALSVFSVSLESAA